MKKYIKTFEYFYNPTDDEEIKDLEDKNEVWKSMEVITKYMRDNITDTDKIIEMNKAFTTLTSLIAEI